MACDEIDPELLRLKGQFFDFKKDALVKISKLERQLKPIPILVFYVGTNIIATNDVQSYVENVRDQFKYLNGYYNVICVARRDSADIEIELLAVDPQKYETDLVDKLLGKFIMEKDDD